MKRAVSIVLAVVLSLQMMACGGNVNEDALKAELKEELKQELQQEAEKAEAEETMAQQEAEEETDKDEADKEEKADEEKEADKEEAADSEKEESGKKAEKGSKGTLDATDWDELTFSLDGTVLSMPFDYSIIKDSWKFDLAEYGYEDGYILNKNDKTFSTIILESDVYDADLSVGFINDSEKQKDILDSKIWAFCMSIDFADSYPDIELPGGITWGSSLEEVEEAYGMPEDEPYRSEDLGYWAYEYSSDDGDVLQMTIYDDGGVEKFAYKIY